MIKEILQKEKTDKCLEEHIFLLEQQRHLLFYSRTCGRCRGCRDRRFDQ